VDVEVALQPTITNMATARRDGRGTRRSLPITAPAA
jgi:hypothetical protein